MKTTMTKFGAFTALALVATVAACGGGGGGSTGNVGGPPPTIAPPTTPPGSATTTATITVVDDQNGNPLAGQPVKLYPWAVGCSTPTPTSVSCPTALPAPQPTTDASGHATLASVPNAEYLLVIGSDSKSDTTRATVHDHVKFVGGTVAYAAPSPLPVPLVTPAAWETNGDYRLASIDVNSELPCFNDMNAIRSQNGAPTLVFDQWLMENVREWALARQNPAYHAGMVDPRNPYGLLTSQQVNVSGGSSCASIASASTFASLGMTAQANDARDLWFGGQWVTYQNGNQAVGTIEFPIDPRAVTDPNALPWP